MRVSYIGWFALAVVTTAAGCGGRVLVGDQSSGLGSGPVSASSPPVNQAPPPTSPTTQPTTPPMPGTPPPSCPLSSPAEFVQWSGSGNAGPSPGVFSLAYSPDGQTLASGIEATEPNVHLYNVSDWTVLRDIAGHAGMPGSEPAVTYAVAFSPDGRTLATAGMGVGEGLEMVKLWDVSTGNLLRVIPADSRPYAEWVAFSPDGMQVCTAGSGPIEIWRVADGTLLESIPNSIGPCRFSPDGTRIVGAGPFVGAVFMAAIWRAADGVKLADLNGHTNDVTDAAFSPDGSEIATGSLDYTVRLWNAATGAPLETLTGHSGYLSRVRWIDQDHLASNDWQGTVILWTRDASGKFTSSCSLSTVTQSLGLDVSPDRTKLVASGGNGIPDGTPNAQVSGFWIFPLRL